MISEQLEYILQQIHEDAESSHHDIIGLEHLLLGLIEHSNDVRDTLVACGANVEKLTIQLLDCIDESTPKRLNRHERDKAVPMSLGLGRVIQRAVLQAKLAKKKGTRFP